MVSMEYKVASFPPPSPPEEEKADPIFPFTFPQATLTLSSKNFLSFHVRVPQ